MNRLYKRLFMFLFTVGVLFGSVFVTGVEAKKKAKWVYTKSTEYFHKADGTWKKSGSTTYKYDNAGRLLQSKSGKYKTKYTYNKQGLLIKVDANSINTHSYDYYTYTASGQVKSHKWYQYDELGSSEEYEYDSKDNVKKEKRCYTGDSTIVNEYKNTYSKGRLSKRIQIGNGKPFMTTKYSYYKDGTLKKKVSEEVKSKIKEIYEYDAKGREIKHTHIEGDDFKEVNLFTYNEHGDQCKRITKTIYKDPKKIKDSGESVYENLYKYDKNGNITEVIDVLDGKELTKRTYEGYKKY